MIYVYAQLIKVLDFGPLQMAHAGAEPLEFRVKILRRSDVGDFFARICRSETFRLQPTLPQSKGSVERTPQ